MHLIVGLGNPGEAYANTRHNLGYRAVEALAGRLDLVFRTPDPAYRLAIGELRAERVVLIEPLTFMNRSGEALLSWADGAGVSLGGGSLHEAALDVARVTPLVVCDDIALPLGTLRLRPHGGAGGHRGLASIIVACGGEDFPRLRLGVAAEAGAPDPEAWADYVLAPFAPHESAAAIALADAAADVLVFVLTSGVTAAAARFNGRLPPPGPEGDDARGPNAPPDDIQD